MVSASGQRYNCLRPTATEEPPLFARDLPISVSLTHRFRVTSGALEPTNRTLADVLIPPSDGPARALFFADSGVAGAWPHLEEQIGAYADAHRQRLVLAGPVAAVPGG